MPSPQALLDRAFHVSLGSLGPGERGVNFHAGPLSLASGGAPACGGVQGRVQVFKDGNLWTAVARVLTSAGPIDVTAKADEQVVAKLLARRGVQAPPSEVARELAKRNAALKVSGTMSAIDTKKDAAARLYTRLSQRDPKAWAAARTLIQRAQAGDPRAQQGWNYLLATHARRQLLGWGTATPAELSAARRAYARLASGDKSAWAALLSLGARAQAGDLKSERAWGILAQVHAENASLPSIGAAVVLAPARVAQLVSLMKSVTAGQGVPLSQLLDGGYGGGANPLARRSVPLPAASRTKVPLKVSAAPVVQKTSNAAQRSLALSILNG